MFVLRPPSIKVAAAGVTYYLVVIKDVVESLPLPSFTHSPIFRLSEKSGESRRNVSSFDGDIVVQWRRSGIIIIDDVSIDIDGSNMLNFLPPSLSLSSKS